MVPASGADYPTGDADHTAGVGIEETGHHADGDGDGGRVVVQERHGRPPMNA
jgi:hypothetical protein